METSILMVCLGNICRSPLAEGVLKSKLSPIKFRIDSAGTQEEKNKVCLILENEEVPDPYYGDENDFKKVFDLLNNACNKIKSDLISSFHAP